MRLRCVTKKTNCQFTLTLFILSLAHLGHAQTQTHNLDSTQALLQAQEWGFLSATWDTAADSLVEGPLWYWQSISLQALPDSVVTRLNYSGDSLSYSAGEQLRADILRRYLQSGYPFASCSFGNLHSTTTPYGIALQSTLTVTPGPLVTWEYPELKVGVALRPKVLSTLLRMPYGQPYDERALERATQRLTAWPYVGKVDSIQVAFENRYAVAEVFAKARAASYLNGIVGWLPRAAPDGSNLLTGEVDFSLWNPLRWGTHTTFFWRRLQPLTQELKGSFLMPSAFGKPISLELEGTLYRQDSTFLNRTATVGIHSPLGLHQQVGLQLQQYSTVGLANSSEPSVTSTLVGVRWAWNSQSIRLAWQPFFQAKVSWAAGQRMRLPQGQSAMATTSFHTDVQVYSSAFWPYNSRIGLETKVLGRWYIAPNLTTTELPRVGGFSTLRGFNENEFSAAQFAVFTLQPQANLGNGSYTFVFLDQMWLPERGHPTGLGVGLSLLTTAGRLEVSGAVGRSAQASFNLATSKIHLGYVSTF